MPVRFLIYLGQEYDKIIARRKENVYGSKLIRLPTPQCVVFYNGSKDMPEEEILRLSDAFENKAQESSVELTVRMININFGHNKELMEKCRKLYEYSYFVDQVQKNTDQGMRLREAVDRAVAHCIDEDILSDILYEHRMEVVGMLINEFNERKHWKLVTKAAIEEGRELGMEMGMETGMKIGREEGRKAGLQEGRKAGLQEGRIAGVREGEDKKLISQVCKKMKKGKDPHHISAELDEPLETVQQIYDAALLYAPEYDAELVCKELHSK